MSAINKAERSRMIGYFALSYLAMMILVALIFYYLFVVIPKIHNRETALTNDRIEEFVQHTDHADSLVIKIQKAPVVESQALIPFYTWTNDLKTVYQQPFYETIVTSYTDLVNEIALSKAKDTTLPTLKTRLVAIQKDNLDLMRRNAELKNQLTMGKVRK
ncbi:hypothetical protein [Salmonirosea aquatica]|uniref:Type VI secretion system transmembrane protein TssO n=1 Tax=Salmonirosea aquatica TaxID=2654236 RepID=A0A7C9BF34_9BACT|nr:hypothetical protein [Cytophagaceae bacterium SJW1-29]